MISHISVVVVTKNEANRIAECLSHIRPHFSDIWVVDSHSGDGTADIARGFGAHIVDFQWNGKHPKKYGCCLEQIKDLQDWVLFIDADEWMREELAAEIRELSLERAGYFIKARYQLGDKVLRFGLCNNKISLINRHKMKFPEVKDLHFTGMGEVEGHYQPVLRAGYHKEKIGQLKQHLIHKVDLDSQDWFEKHRLYAKWEAKMDKGSLWPKENRMGRRILKAVFKSLPCRQMIAFLHSYIVKLGILDGWEGLDLALSRYRYYKMIRDEARALKASKPKG